MSLCLYATVTGEYYRHFRCSKIVAKITIDIVSDVHIIDVCVQRITYNRYHAPRRDVYRCMCITRSREVHIMHNIIIASSCIAVLACKHNTMILLLLLLLCYNIKSISYLRKGTIFMYVCTSMQVCSGVDCKFPLLVTSNTHT